MRVESGVEGMTEAQAIWTVVIGAGALLGLWATVKSLFTDPLTRLTEDMRQQHEEFRVETTAQGARVEKTIEAVSRAQSEISELEHRVSDNTVRIVVLEQKVNKDE